MRILLMHGLWQSLCIFFFFFFLHTQFITSLSSSKPILCPHDQSIALLQFKNTFPTDVASVCDKPEVNIASWNEDVDCCLWDGVTCEDETGNVIGLQLSCSGLQGTIHSNSSIFQLSHLQRLNLAYNDFESYQISNKFGRFPNLTHLNLSSSSIAGELPFELSHLSRLVSLDLSDNLDLELETSMMKNLAHNLTHLRELILQGTIMGSVSPSFLMNLSSSLTSLNLGSTGIVGNFPAAYIFSLPNLQILKLMGNTDLKGFLPESNWSSSLKYLDLMFCHFEGLLPTSIGNFTKITYIDLSTNNFSGVIPSSFSNLAQLEYLSLHDNNFEGQIPDVFEKVSKLTALSLGKNRFTGQLPSSIFNLPLVSFLAFQHNNFEGSFPEFKSGLSKLSYIDLSSSSLNGTIPPWLFGLPSLQFLYLQNNHLGGNISEATSKSLQSIDLSGNSLSGSIPRSFFELENMTDLRLSSNILNGVVEMDMSSNLKNLIMLDLRGNLLEGELPIPPKIIAFFLVSKNNFTGELSSSICQLEQLRVLDLSYNSLAGKIPHCLGNFSNELSEMNLGMNSFQGTIPEAFGTMVNLRSLIFNGNSFVGSLPRSLLNCSKLEVLDVGNNKLHDIFPHWLETLPELQVIVLRSNSFHGFVRGSKTNKTNNIFPRLKIFDISRNNFSGPFPTGYVKNFKAIMNLDGSKSDELYIGENDSFSGGYSLELTIKGQEMALVKVLTILTTIDLSDNRFEGEIPKVIGELKSLKSLNLSRNNFTGHIPASIGLLANLEGLDLSSNNLSGEIPEEMANLTFLSFLNLSRNNLIGSIPQGHQLDTFGNDSYIGNLRLCGVPLTKKCSDEEGSQPPPLTNFQQEDEMEHESLLNWKAISLGYACGIVYGVVMGYFLFHRGRYRAWVVCLYC